MHHSSAIYGQQTIHNRTCKTYATIAEICVMRLENISNSLKDTINIFYPDLCAACDAILVRGETGICAACVLELPRTFDETNPTDSRTAKIFAGRIPVKYACALFAFQKQSKVQELLHRIKYESRREAGETCGALMAETFNVNSRFNEIDLVIPVPLHPKKLAKRGYNQAEVVARGVGEQLNKPVLPKALERVHYNDSQTTKGRMSRMESVEGLFRVRLADQLKNKHVLIVDDVITTGATIESCIQPLLAVPGITVSIAALAAAHQ